MDDHAIDTLLREAHVVALPDADVVQRERAKLDALLAGSARVPGDRTVRAHRRRRTPLVMGVSAAVALCGVGAAAAGGLFDSNTERMVDSADCDIRTEDAELVASEIDSIGLQIEYWVLDREGGHGDMLIEKSPDGTVVGSQLGCGAGRRSETPYYATQSWAVAPYTFTPGVATYVRLYGQIPPSATAATVVLSDGTSVIVTPDNAQGYFLQLVTLEPDPNIDVVSVEPNS
ncbi:MAG: hypothetical protein HZB15_16175 [Actinobacteria bacterium]|nr:hypothetical protein [Actinomycetota bacterium]